ncbi:MAG: adenosylmethionine--8-amino-7-oxononanoate transaminase [Mariprofundaceae bacterium]
MHANLWYPYTSVNASGLARPMLRVEGAEGPYLIAKDGRRYIDGNGSWWVSNLGHQHPRLVAALKHQADRMCHVSLAGISHEPAEALAEALVGVAPDGLAHVFFTDDGSTAIEVAVRMALQYHQQTGHPGRNRFIALEGAFHGETVTSASLSDIPVFHQSLSCLAFDCERISSPGVNEDVALTELFNLLNIKGESIAALLLEPLVQGAGGMRMHSPHFLTEARRLTREHDVLLIADEVFVGYGRTGTMWACDQAGITPDILCTAKGFTGGMLPMAATLTTGEIFQAFVNREGETDRTLLYGHSYCGNPLACAVALEVLRVYREEGVIDGIAARGEILQAGIEKLATIDGVTNPRRSGLIAAVDLPPMREEGYQDPVGWQVYDEALKSGAYLRPLGNVLYFVPALNMPVDVLRELADTAAESVTKVLNT